MDSNIAMLLRSVRSCPRFDKQQEAELAASMLEGDGKAREQLIRSCMPLAISEAKKYADRAGSIPLDDMIGWAMIGLVRGVDRFDPKRGRLTTCCVWHIRQSCLLVMATKDALIRTPSYLAETSKKNHRSYIKYRSYAEAAKRIVSLDDMQKLTQEQVLSGSIADDEDALTRLCKQEQLERLRSCLELLPHRDLFVLEQRFFCNKTLEQIGSVLKVCSERVRQLEENALCRLLRLMASGGRINSSTEVA